MPELPEASSKNSLKHAKLLIRDGQITEAKEILLAVLDDQTNHKEALFYYAVCLRRLGNYSQAFDTLDQLLSQHPAYGRAYQDYGHNYMALNNHEAALQNFEIAVSLNPNLIASWKALANLYQSQSRISEAAQAQRRIEHLTSMPAELVSVGSLLCEDKVYLAEQLCRQYLQKNKHHPEAMRLLAEIGSRLQILDDAEFLLQKCVEFYPDFHHARLDYVQVLQRRQKFEAALEQAKKLHQIDKSSFAFRLSLASSHQALGEFEKALTIYDDMVRANPSNPSVLLTRGHALKTIGRIEQAIESYQRAYKAAPSYGDAYWSLANLKVYQFSDKEVDSMRKQQSLNSISLNDKTHLCFALGKALEDRSSFAESFEFYQKGNKLKQSVSHYSSDKLLSDFEQQKALFDAAFFEQRKGFGNQSDAPIFIVGLPRAGSTLLEQILASHSQVDGTMELANVIGLANRLGGRATVNRKAQYPAILEKLSHENCLKFGQDYIDDTQVHRQSGRFFIDKMPNNFRHIALIHLILPNAKIIDARREPMACCFSGFKQLFAEGQEFSYGLESIGTYYRAYVDLMSHWENTLPGRILRVQHEDVINDLEPQVRRILDYCGLDFEQNCVDFHKTERAVRTPSSEQVRQPIYKSGMQQWKNYADFLDPLIDSLGETKERYRE